MNIRGLVTVLIMFCTVVAFGQRRTNIYSSGLTTGAQTINFDADDYGVASASIANASGGEMVVTFDYVLQGDRTITIPDGFILNVSYGSDRIKILDIVSSGGANYWIMGNNDNRGTSESSATMSIVPIVAAAGGGGGGGDASATNQVATNTLLTAIRDSITAGNQDIRDNGSILTDILAKPSIDYEISKQCYRTATDTVEGFRVVVVDETTNNFISNDVLSKDLTVDPAFIATVECPQPDSEVTIKGSAIIEDVYRFDGTAVIAATPLNTGGVPGNVLSLAAGTYKAYACKWSPQTSVDPGDGSVASVTINGASYFPTETGLYKSVLKSVSAGPNNTTASPLNVSATGQGFCECTILK